MRATAYHAQRRSRMSADRDGHASAPTGFAPCARAGNSTVGGVTDGNVDYAQLRAVPQDQGDVHRELAIARDEFPGAVQRIHQPVPGPLAPLGPGQLNRLFRQDGQ